MECCTHCTIHPGADGIDEDMSFFLFFLLTGIILNGTPLEAGDSGFPPASHVSIAAYHRALPRINKRLTLKRLSLGSPLLIRIFKHENELELWLADGQEYKRYKTYSICFRSGTLGPKLTEGDRQSPEGFYSVGYEQMNPWSDFHLAFNLGYPNEYDRAYNRSGSALMIHGRCSSDGCFAMTDYHMDEIYTLAHAALEGSQAQFQVHIFPFRLSEKNIRSQRNSPWITFWRNLKEGYDFFEKHHRPPAISVANGHYVITDPAEEKPPREELELFAGEVEQVRQERLPLLRPVFSSIPDDSGW